MRHGGKRTTTERGLVARLAGLILMVLLAACAPASRAPSSAAGGSVTLVPATLSTGQKLRVVATTSIVADLVRNVGGEQIDLQTLLPIGTDPHAFQPTPRDATALSKAHVIMANGAGLEEFLAPLLQSAGANVPVVELSEGIVPRKLSPAQAKTEGASADPHTWTTPSNAIVFVRNAARALSALDPTHAGDYEARAQSYMGQLQDLDVWVKAQIAAIPADKRKLVTDHEEFGYYTERYGLQQIGAIIPSFSSLAEPSAQQRAALEDAVRQNGVKVIFVDTTVNPGLAQRIAQDTGVRLVTLTIGSLGPAGSDSHTYLDYVRYITNTIAKGLLQG